MNRLMQAIRTGKWIAALALAGCIWLPMSTCTYYVTPSGETTWVATGISADGRDTTSLNIDSSTLAQSRRIEVPRYSAARNPRDADFGWELLSLTWAVLLLGAAFAFRHRRWAPWIARLEPVCAIWFGAPYVLFPALFVRPAIGARVAAAANVTLLCLWCLEVVVRRRMRTQSVGNS